jgi:hypothetical protein
MADTDKVTVDHEEIRAWVEKHQGQPQRMDHPGNGNGTAGLRIDFPGKEDEEYLSETEQIQQISWEVFFDYFEKQQLAFEYDEKVIDDPSDSYRFIKREHIDEEA